MLAKAILGTSICAVKKAHLFLLGCNDARKAFHELFAAVLLQGRQVPKQVRFDDGRHICLEGPQNRTMSKPGCRMRVSFKACAISVSVNTESLMFCKHMMSQAPKSSAMKQGACRPLSSLCHFSLCEYGVPHVLHAQDQSGSQIVTYKARCKGVSFKAWAVLVSVNMESLMFYLHMMSQAPQIVSHEARRMQASFKARTISVSVTIESLMFLSAHDGSGRRYTKAK